jgi:hypothetical protein
VIDYHSVSFDDAIERERRSRDYTEQARETGKARWESAAMEGRQVAEEFVGLMARAGRPGLREFKQKRGKPNSLFSDLLPARRILGWQVANGSVITPDGSVYVKFLDTDELSQAPPRELERSFQHGYSIDGIRSGPYSADELRQLLAKVLIDTGVAR